MADKGTTSAPDPMESQKLDDSDVVTLTLNDVLEIEDAMIENTAKLLGAADDKICSYVEGYLKRQALYSCLTCIPEAKTDPEKGAGVCLACSYHCHDGHELIELYTKRNFRCDCGNSKFVNADSKCSLFGEKSTVNDMNTYNQNFSGTYCVCHRPYPDPEDPVPDEMIQCIICEDWYHSRHLGIEVPSDDFAEMICEACVTKHEFLMNYSKYSINRAHEAQHEHTEVNVVDVNTTEESSKSEDKDGQQNLCKKPRDKPARTSAMFWPDLIWRKQLCTCDDCLKMYETEDVVFLLDTEDPVHLYEEKGKAKAKQVVEDHDQKFMESMDRVQLVEVIAGYNDLKSNLSEFLKKFADNKKIIRTEDVKEFFDGMQARKKQKVDMSYFCR